VLGIPTELDRAARLITDPNAAPKSFDMMRVGNAFVFGVVALGVMGDVAVNTDRAAKDRLGNVAYGISAVKASWHAHRNKSDYIIRLDGREVRSRGIACLITNHGAGFFNVKPPIIATDGLLNVMVFSGKRIRTITGAAANVVTRNERFMPVEHWQAKVVEVISEPAQNIQADGEVLPAGQVTVQVVPNAVNFIVPVNPS
jgi:diacylglycerol kinase family enzyme